jgi:hypothetical protein
MVHAVACWLARCCYCVQHVSCVVFGCLLAAAGRLLVIHVIEAMRTLTKHVVVHIMGCMLLQQAKAVCWQL